MLDQQIHDATLTCSSSARSPNHPTNSSVPSTSHATAQVCHICNNASRVILAAARRFSAVSRLPRKLGPEIRRARLKAGIGLRELARRIENSPAYVVALERADDPPGVTEKTLTAIAAELSLSPDVLMTLASKVPDEVKPKTALEVELYRRVRQLPVERQLALLETLKGAEADGGAEDDSDEEAEDHDRR